MKQIVFLVSALVVLLQLHSTTASADSQAGWDEIDDHLELNTDQIEIWADKLKDDGISAWKAANVEIPEKWGQSVDAVVKRLDKIKTELIEAINEHRPLVSVEWVEIKPEIDELMRQITVELRKLTKKISDTASGTLQEINDSVSEVTEELASLMETKTIQTENVLKNAVQKKLNAEQTDSQAGWDEIHNHIQSNTDTVGDWMKELKETGDSAWKKSNVKAPAQWGEFLASYIQRLDKIKIEFSELIGELRKTVPVKWTEIKQQIDELMDRILFTIRELAKKIVDAAPGTQQTIDDSVSEAIEKLTTLMDTEVAYARNTLNEAVQKKLNAAQTADGQESQANE